VASATFTCFVLIDKKNILDANITFVSLSLLDIMRFPVIILPVVISSIIKAKVALKRITTFLLREEIDANYFTLDYNSSKVIFEFF
jgi:ATP-binding cassette, subfamily C (CFTR/MRP), member 1